MTELALTDFLLARIAEDEAVAVASREHEHFSLRDRFGLTWVMDDGYGRITVTSGRVLAECEAKRRIVDLHTEREWAHSPTLRALALPYADHPDYRDEWRP